MGTSAEEAAAVAAAAAQLNVMSIAAKPQPVKLEALAMFTGTRDQDKNLHLKHWALALSAQDAEKSAWAKYAACRINPSILPIFQAGQDVDFDTMSWEDFCTRFRGMSTAGSTINTAEAQHNALERTRFNPRDPQPAADIVRKVDTIRNAYPDSRLSDSTVIHYVLKAIHPQLRQFVTYTSEGKDYDTYASFCANLLAQAAVHEPRLLAPSSNDHQQQRGNGPNRRGPFKPQQQRGNGRNHPYGGKPQRRFGNHQQQPKQPSGMRYFKCKGFGHKANDCPTPGQVSGTTAVATVATVAAAAACPVTQPVQFDAAALLDYSLEQRLNRLRSPASPKAMLASPSNAAAYMS